MSTQDQRVVDETFRTQPPFSKICECSVPFMQDSLSATRGLPFNQGNGNGLNPLSSREKTQFFLIKNHPGVFRRL